MSLFAKHGSTTRRLGVFELHDQKPRLTDKQYERLAAEESIFDFCRSKCCMSTEQALAWLDREDIRADLDARYGAEADGAATAG